MNTAQFLPRASKELQVSPEQYHKLQVLLAKNKGIVVKIFILILKLLY